MFLKMEPKGEKTLPAEEDPNPKKKHVKKCKVCKESHGV